MKKTILLLPAMLISLIGCSKGSEPTVMQFDYVFTAQPVVSATNSTIFKNVQSDFVLKSSGKRIMQASVFVKKDTSSNKLSNFLNSLRSDIQNGLDNPGLIKTGIEALASPQQQQAKYGVPGAMALKVTNSSNGFSLGYEETSLVKEETSAFAKLLNPKIGELTDDHIFDMSVTETESFSDLKILAPTGAPAIAFYNYATNANFETTGSPSDVIIPAFRKGMYDVIVAPTHGGLMQIINNQANYKIAATITFGNMYIVSMGTDTDNELNEGDRVLYFQKNDLPGKIFEYVYGDLKLNKYAVENANNTKLVIENKGILRV